MDTEHLCLLFLSKSYFLSNNCYFGCLYLDVSKNRGTPKWMVKIMENPIKMDDLGGKTDYFRKHLSMFFVKLQWCSSLPEFLVSPRVSEVSFFLGEFSSNKKNGSATSVAKMSTKNINKKSLRPPKKHQVPKFFQPFASSPLLFVPPKRIH